MAMTYIFMVALLMHRKECKRFSVYHFIFLVCLVTYKQVVMDYIPKCCIMLFKMQSGDYYM